MFFVIVKKIGKLQLARPVVRVRWPSRSDGSSEVVATAPPATGQTEVAVVPSADPKIDGEVVRFAGYSYAQAVRQMEQLGESIDDPLLRAAFNGFADQSITALGDHLVGLAIGEQMVSIANRKEGGVGDGIEVSPAQMDEDKHTDPASEE